MSYTVTDLHRVLAHLISEGKGGLKIAYWVCQYPEGARGHETV